MFPIYEGLQPLWHTLCIYSPEEQIFIKLKEMKKFIITSVLAVLAAAMTTVSAQKYPKEYLGLPGDNLNLYAVMDLFRNSPSLEAFERSLNDMDSRINNLDLNRDNRVDYITVSDYRDGRVHTIVLRAVLGRKEFQDVAVITVEKLRRKKVMIQLIGDVALYGRNYIIEPVYSKKHKSKRYIDPVYYGNTRIINNYYYDIYDWPVVVYISSPGYSGWSSSYYWGYYPAYWDSWKPYYWDFYYGYHSGWHSHYYSHYHHSDIQRYRRYNDFYYHSIRQESPEVRHRIAEGNYRQTYSRPEQRSEGVALYTRTRSEVNSDVRDRVPAGTRERRDAAPQSVTGTVPNAASETGRRTATESRSVNSTGTRADSRTASDATPARRSPATVSNRAPESSVDYETREARRVSTEAENRTSEVRAAEVRASQDRAVKKI